MYTFNLKYKALLIGTLNFEQESWCFSYSPEFKAQKSIRTLICFPDKEKVYVSGQLWSFFIARIPSIKQPHIKLFMDNNNIKNTDNALMLKYFGNKCISNPYELVSV